MSLRSRFQMLRMAWALGKDVSVSQTGTWLTELMAAKEPMRRGTRELMVAYRQLPWLRAVTQKIGTSVAAVDWELSTVRSGRKYVQDRVLQRGLPAQRALRRVTRKAAGELIVLDTHPLLDLLDRGNNLLDGRAVHQVMQHYLDLKGDAYLLMERNALDLPTELYPLPPHWIQEVPTATRPHFRVSFPDGSQRPIPASEILWLRDPNPENPYGRGVGIAEALGDELDTDEYAAQHTKAAFYNRAIPPAIITVKGVSELVAKALKVEWENLHRGYQKAHQTHFTSAEIDVKELGQSFVDLQLIELRKFERDTIIQVFGVPPEVLGIIENSNRATIEAANYLFQTLVIVPRLEFWRSALQQQLVPLFDERLVLEYISPVPEDKDFTLKVAQAAPYARTRNEWRALQGLPARPDADVYDLPFNLMPTPAVIGAMEGMMRSWSVPHRKGMTPGDVERVLDDLDPARLTVELDPKFKALVDEWGAKALADLGLDATFNLLNPRVVEYLQTQSATKIKGLIQETTRQTLRDTLTVGVQAGEEIRDLAKRIREVFSDADRRRSVTIARTEVVGASNWATTEAYRQSGVVTRRQWVATRDERTREAHAALDGVEAGINDPFVIASGEFAGASADSPGNFGDPALDINCRCTTVAVIENPLEEAQLDGIWKRYDRELVPYETQITAAARRGFRAQEDDILAALDRFA